MKKAFYALAALVLAVVPQAKAFTVQSTVTPGVWCSDMAKALAYAEENNMPLFAFYGVTGCAYCTKAINMMDQATFKNWQANRKIVMLYLHEEAWSDNDKWQFASDGWSVNAFPACRVYWPKEDGSVAGKAFLGRQNHTGYKAAIFADEMIGAIERYIKDWSAAPAKAVVSFAETSASVVEGSQTTVSVTRTGGASAVSATVTVDAESGIKIVSGGKEVDKLALSWSAGDKSSKTITVLAPYDAKIAGNVTGKLTLTATSTTAAPVEVKNGTFTLTATDSFLSKLGSWTKNISIVKGSWANTTDNLLETGTNGAEFKITAAKAGIATVTIDASGTEGAKVGVGNRLVTWTPNTRSTTVKVGLSANQSLRLISQGDKCAFKSVRFTAFGTPTIKTPANNASYTKDQVIADKSLLDLAWATVSGAESYVVTVGDVEQTVTAGEKLNAVDMGAVDLESDAAATVKWSVKAICASGVDVGTLESTDSATFKLTVKPVFNDNFPESATVYRKIGSKIDVSATGASGITYSITKGSLPTGMSLDAKTGIISGTPSRVKAATSVTIKATSSNGQSVSKTIKIASSKLPSSVAANYVGVEESNGKGVAGYEVRISSSGKLTVKRTTASGTGKISASIAVDYSSGSREFVISMANDKLRGTPSAGFVGKSVTLVKATSNAALNSYSNLGVYDNDGNVYGYLSAKVTAGNKMRVTGYVGKSRITQTVKFSAKNGKAFFASNGVSGILQAVAGKGVGSVETTISVGSASYKASGGIYKSGQNVSALKGYVLACNGKSVTVTATSSKLSVPGGNSAGATLKWKKATGLFSGVFGSLRYNAALTRINGVWIGCGVTTSGKEVILSKPE